MLNWGPRLFGSLGVVFLSICRAAPPLVTRTGTTRTVDELQHASHTWLLVLSGNFSRVDVQNSVGLWCSTNDVASKGVHIIEPLSHADIDTPRVHKQGLAKDIKQQGQAEQQDSYWMSLCVCA